MMPGFCRGSPGALRLRRLVSPRTLNVIRNELRRLPPRRDQRPGRTRGCRRWLASPLAKRGGASAGVDPGGERQTRHARLDADQNAHRSRHEIPLPVGRRVLLAHERARGGARSSFFVQHQSAVAVSDRHLPHGLLRRRRRAARASTRGPFPGGSSPIRRWAGGACASAGGSRAATLTIPAEWPSGVYVGKLTAEREGLQSYVIFIVRDDRPADFLFQCSDNTWQAYNRWPSQFSLYDDGKDTWYWGPGVRRQLRPALRQVLPDPRPAAVDRLGRMVPLGVPARLLAGAARLRRDLHLQPRHARRPGGAAAEQRVSVASATTSTDSIEMFDQRQGRDRRGAERRVLLGQHLLRPDRPAAEHRGRPESDLLPGRTATARRTTRR